MAAYEETLRSLALNDEDFLESVLGMGHDTVEVSRLDKKTHALVRLGAAFAIDAAPSSTSRTSTWHSPLVPTWTRSSGP